MKKKIIVISSLVVAALLIYVTPIVVSKSRARPLSGHFDMGSKCMGGHEIFLLLEQNRYYFDCPGHDDKNEMGIIRREGASATIFEHDGVTPWAHIDFDGSEHFITYAGEKEKKPLPQVVSPWRLKLPYYLSRDH